MMYVVLQTNMPVLCSADVLHQSSSMLSICTANNDVLS